MPDWFEKKVSSLEQAVHETEQLREYIRQDQDPRGVPRLSIEVADGNPNGSTLEVQFVPARHRAGYATSLAAANRRRTILAELLEQPPRRPIPSYMNLLPREVEKLVVKRLRKIGLSTSQIEGLTIPKWMPRRRKPELDVASSIQIPRAMLSDPLGKSLQSFLSQRLLQSAD